MNMDLCAAAVHRLAQLEVVSTFGQANLAASKYFTSHSKIWQTGSENWKHKKLIRNCNEMASSLLSFRYVPSMPSLKQTSSRPSLQIRAQCFRDEGSVDGNMSILRERIEEVRIKERLERCCRIGNGWNYATGNDYKHKRSAGSSQFFEVFGMVFGTLGLTIVTGSLCLWLVSLFIQYLYQ